MRHALAVLTFVLVSPAFAQPTVGDITGKGAQKMSKEDVQKLISGATVSFSTPAGISYQLVHEAGGAINGGGAAPRGQFTAGGNWSVNDAGKLCERVSTPGGGFGSCYDVYKAGDNYFFAGDDGKALPRKITR